MALQYSVAVRNARAELIFAKPCATLNLNDVNVTSGRKMRVVSFVTTEGNA